MFFNSVSYIVFLCVAVIAYWLMPLRIGRWWLLLVSIAFYGIWKVEFLCLIIFSAFVDYYISLKIYDAQTHRGRKLWLITSLVINLGLLMYFKYTYFISNNIAMIGNLFGLDWSISVGTIILPLGISFYTFVSLSYTIDIYRRLLDPVRDFGLYLTYVMFWPHMIAGPILRGHELIAQIKRGHRFSAENVVIGIKKILAGLFLKVALADQLAPLVNSAFSANAKLLGGLDVWTMAFAFGFQIYFDFAGYSLIALGSARLIGIYFPDNFNWPYLATSPREFWKRWHITLSSWVRDYLYLPLSGSRYRDRSDGGIDINVGGSRTSANRLTLALFLSWFIMGLWHGARWNFAIWGVWHATVVFIYRNVAHYSAALSKRATAIIGWLLTVPLMMLAWIPFRAETLSQTFNLLEKIVQPHSYLHLSFRENFYLVTFLIMTGMLLCALISTSYQRILRNLVIRRIAEVFMWSMIIYFDFVFLKPVHQFIYFEF